MKHLIFVFAIFAGIQAAAAELDPMMYMRKISERVTGKWPTPVEYQSLRTTMRNTGCETTECLGAFFKDYIDAKLNTAAFYSEASLKVHERFAFTTPSVVPFPADDGSFSQDDLGIQSLLVYRTLRDDLPVDELFVSQIQTRVKPDTQSFARFGTFEVETEKAVPPVPQDGDPNILGTVRIETLDFTGHPNVSGIFSTQKFLTRYWNTPINGNRKRAAAVFKIMLCDPMNPALERATAKERENALAQGVSEANVTKRSIEEIHKNRHGNQKDCAQCHNRLDPLARSMRPLELGISKFAAKGRLRFYDAVNQPVDHPADNFAQLIKKITQQPKYDDCQMDWLFNWIVGKDVKIHPARFAELSEQFSKDGRKMKSTIANLLASPEFRGQSASFEEPASFRAASKVLSNCADCHSPFLKSHGAQLKLTLSKISRRLDLANDGKNRQMPPDYHYWAPNQSDIAAVKNWIRDGAPMIEGRALLNAAEVNVLLKPGVAK